MANVFCGTSGFSYASWKPEFYPADLPSKKFLSYYSNRLNCVEINYTFRRLVSATTLENWTNSTPAGFLFCPKAHMRITHILRLREPEFTRAFLKTLEPLGDSGRLGPILFQLPPNYRCDIETLALFLSALPKQLRFAFEFRHESWLLDAVYALLADHNVALCQAESEGMKIPDVVTADFAYSRLRMPSYLPAEREDIAARVEGLLKAGKDVFVFFKHEESPAGAFYAEELLSKTFRPFLTGRGE